MRLARHHKIHRAILGTTLSLALVLGACSPSPSTGPSRPDDITATNLVRIWLLLRHAAGESFYFPRDLAQLELMHAPVPKELFVCAGTGSRVGSLSTIDQWTDYIYVAQVPDLVILETALLISPPENHGGSYGYVLFAGGNVVRLPADEVRRLVNDPLALATNSSTNTIAFVRGAITVQVPDRLKPYYPAKAMNLPRQP